MKAYISVSLSKRKFLEAEIAAIKDKLKTFGITSFLFVDQYKFSSAEEKQMMEQAMTDIDCCDMLIAETSDKGIGIGIEAGYAKAKGKTVIYLRQADAEHSTTLSGISDFRVIYFDKHDLGKQLSEVLSEMISKQGRFQ